MGDGAFSNVYKAIDKLSGQKVAGKRRDVVTVSYGLLMITLLLFFSQSGSQVRTESFAGKRPLRALSSFLLRGDSGSLSFE